MVLQLAFLMSLRPMPPSWPKIAAAELVLIRLTMMELE